MAEIELGSKFEWLQHIVTLRSIGRIKVLVGRGIVIGVGEAARGPANELYGMTRASQALATYRSGPLKDDLETALDQNCDAAFGYRILGANYATASATLVDSQTEPGNAGVLSASGPGVWGNIPSITIEDGDMAGSMLETFPGTAQTTPYTLERDDLVEAPTYAYVTVGATTKTIVYSGPADPGEAFLDKTAGELSFATGEWPTTADQVAVRYKFASRKITIRDNDGRPPVVLNNIMSLTMLAARLTTNSVCHFEPTYGATHLPKTYATFAMTGGSDGSAITIDDWEAAFNDIVDTGLPGNAVAAAIFTTAYEVTAGTMDIVPLMDAFLWKMGDKKRPLQGFMCFDPTMTAEEMRDFKAGYVNMFMTLISNGFSATERNLAAARAGQEAALALGTSPATDSNSFKGVDGLLFQWDDIDRRTLTDVGIEVLIKETGVHPYLGVSTDTDESFFRTVDVRTICEWIIMSDFTIQKFMNEKRTLTNLARLKTSLYMILHTMKRKSVLDDCNLEVSADPDDHNGVLIDTMLQPVGHMERFYHDVAVGYWSDAVAA